MSEQNPLHTPSRSYALRGAAVFGLMALLTFGIAAAVAGEEASQTDYFVLAAAICGVAAGLAYGRWAMALVLALNFAAIEFMFILKDAPSNLLIDAVWTGLTSAFLFGVAGACATLTLPMEQRFNGAGALTVGGGVAGILFQLLSGPARPLMDPAWTHVVLWTVAGVCGGYLFGAGIDRAMQPAGKTGLLPGRNRWLIVSVVFGVSGLLIGALSYMQSATPPGLPVGTSPARTLSDWWWSWGVLTLVLAVVGATRGVKRNAGSRRWVVGAVGLVTAVVMIWASFGITRGTAKTRFENQYAANLLGAHAREGDPLFTEAVYVGNLIMARAALDVGNVEEASRLLLASVAGEGNRQVEEAGPDVSVARDLLERGERESVLEFLERCRKLWPEGKSVLDRWINAIRDGRQPNFNRRNPEAE